MKTYITGASGRLGRLVMEKVDATAIVRRKSGIGGEIVCDFEGSGLKDILDDADRIIHLAGSRDFLDIEKAREGNVKLTERILDAMPPGAKIIYSSSISVYGKKMAEIPADELTPPRPDTAYAKSKIEAEEAIRKSGILHNILRIGPVYGPGFEEYFKVLGMIEKGKMKIIGDGKNRIPFVHGEDVSLAIQSSLDSGGGTYVITGKSMSQEEVFEVAANALGAPVPTRHVPLILAKAYSQIELFRKEHSDYVPKFIPEDIAVLSSDRAFDCKKARQELGFKARPLKSGIEEMVRTYRQE
jgi:nucleoside-diphosphate-sugar epimerase